MSLLPGRFLLLLRPLEGTGDDSGSRLGLEVLGTLRGILAEDVDAHLKPPVLQAVDSRRSLSFVRALYLNQVNRLRGVAGVHLEFQVGIFTLWLDGENLVPLEDDLQFLCFVVGPCLAVGFETDGLPRPLPGWDRASIRPLPRAACFLPIRKAGA